MRNLVFTVIGARRHPQFQMVCCEKGWFWSGSGDYNVSVIAGSVIDIVPGQGIVDVDGRLILEADW